MKGFQLAASGAAQALSSAGLTPHPGSLAINGAILPHHYLCGIIMAIMKPIITSADVAVNKKSLVYLRIVSITLLYNFYLETLPQSPIHFF